MPPAATATSAVPSRLAPLWKAQMPALIASEKWQGVNGQREDQPAEQADTNGIEEKSKREHGGGSMCIGATVARSTTTAAQFWK
jgi:hypothetical protein